ncbi:hypothetical protein ATI61_11767 [Archangium gephyra]|uniref:Uncharacterized protein n=1 Tax=Archangium gephyra TaxID=48 RepID=A0AAC8Q8A1_9BACT|nr:hypothetical protein [Archangium gephyra]AKJ02679.1 Hypothetical protein AA314_04305 [Archangium gephyra]REG23224.1 hypothetical protein ATI61_11767 [Archangium gephyra]
MSTLVCALSLVLLGTAPMEVSRGMLFEAAPERLDARVGEWVTYQMDGGPQPGFLRLAVVAEQKDARGRDAVWVELEFGQHPALKAPLAQFLLLVARDTGLRTEGVSRLFVTQGFEKLQEVDTSALPFFLGSPRPPPSARLPVGQGSTVRRGPPTRLMTFAGTVTAEPLEVRHRQLVLKRYWVSRELPILHLAKLEFPPIRYALEVRDHGLDARPRLVPPSPGDKKITLEPASHLPPHFQPVSQSGTAWGTEDNRP